MKALFSVVPLYIEIIQLRLAILKYDFLIGFHSAREDHNNHLDQKK